MSLDKTAAAVVPAASETLVATVARSGASNRSVTWVSNNNSVVSISAEGTVMALSTGTAVITATTEEGRYTATCEVTVGNFPCTSPTAFGTADAISWSLCPDGTFTIGSNGPIHDYPSDSGAPWGEHTSGVTTVVIEDGVTNIGDSAFRDCDNLTTVTIPSTVTEIGEGAFGSCTDLTNVTIPSTVTEIGDNAFNGCTGLTEFINESTVPQTITLDVFDGMDVSSVTLFVPAEAVDAYHAAEVWKEFGTIEAIAVTRITVTSAAESVKKGENLKFTAEVNARGGASTDITWSVSGNTSDETTVDSVADDAEGLFTVAATTLTVTATSVFDPTKNTAKAVTVESITSTGELLTPELKAYPNPFTDAVRLTRAEGCTLRIINAAEVTVHIQKVDSPDATVNLERLPAGMYFFQIEKDGKVKSARVIKN